jgi:fatty acid desaturase
MKLDYARLPLTGSGRRAIWTRELFLLLVLILFAILVFVAFFIFVLVLVVILALLFVRVFGSGQKWAGEEPVAQKGEMQMGRHGFEVQGHEASFA